MTFRFLEKLFYLFQRSAHMRWADYPTQMLIRRYKLFAEPKHSSEHQNPPIANVLLVAGLLSIVCVIFTI